MTIIFLKPIFQDRIWGGSALQQWFSSETLGSKVGEAWLISAHPNGSSIVEAGPYAGVSLDVLYREQPALFGYPKDDTFPLLMKILDAETSLSVQVHPNDVQAKKISAGERGKTECWYVLDAKPKTKMILGHKAKSAKELFKRVKKNKWKKLLVNVPIKKSDFVYIPSGTIHALGAGALVLEVQQSSDITYRLYDYERNDETGKKRELHVKEALDVITVPYESPSVNQHIFEVGKNKIITFLDNRFFTVKKLQVRETFDYKRVAHYVLVTVIDGAGTVNGETIVKGSAFIVPATVSDVVFAGAFDAIISYVN